MKPAFSPTLARSPAPRNPGAARPLDSRSFGRRIQGPRRGSGTARVVCLPGNRSPRQNSGPSWRGGVRSSNFRPDSPCRIRSPAFLASPGSATLRPDGSIIPRSNSPSTGTMTAISGVRDKTIPQFPLQRPSAWRAATRLPRHACGIRDAGSVRAGANWRSFHLGAGLRDQRLQTGHARGLPPDARHPVLLPHPVSGRIALYLPDSPQAFSERMAARGERSNRSSTPRWRLGIYEHVWTPGDLLCSWTTSRSCTAAWAATATIRACSTAARRVPVSR